MLQFVNTMFKNISQKMLNRNDGGRFKEAAAAQILSIFFTIALLYQLSSSSASFW